MATEILKSKSAFDNNLKNVDFHVYSLPKTERHTHFDYYELVYILKGPVRYEINGKNLILDEGILSIVRPTDIHSFNNEKEDKTQHINLAVKVEFFKLITNLLNPFLFEQINSAHAPRFLKLSKFERLEIEYWKRKINMEQESDREESSPLITALLCMLISIYNGRTNFMINNSPSWFNDLLQLINSSEFADKSVSDIYEHCNYSPPVIIKAFKKYLGQTPVEYITNVKINYACNLLQNTDYSTLHISSKIGYDSLSHFNRVFKKIKGVTPSHYRLKQ